MGKGLMAFFTLVVFEAYLRPSEALALTVAQLTPPVPGHSGVCQQWTLRIRGTELGQPGKTGEFDHSIAFDLPWHQILSAAFSFLTSSLPAAATVFPFTYADYLDCWMECCMRGWIELGWRERGSGQVAVP